MLDAAGGTDIFQMPTGRLKLTAGADALRCLRLSGKGILRWYADCCRTPIGNTVGPRVPVVGLIHSFMRGEAGGRSLSAVLGAPLCLPHLCWLGQRAAAGGRAAAGLVRALLAPRIDDSALVVAWARPAEPVLRRADRRAAFRAARAHAERTRRALKAPHAATAPLRGLPHRAPRLKDRMDARVKPAHDAFSEIAVGP